MIDELLLQNDIFDQNVTRKQLLSYTKIMPERFKVYVYRNHSFELVEHLLSMYLDYAKIGVQFLYSDYDDSLSFQNIPEDIDAFIIWLDVERYKTNQLGQFLQDRIEYLKKIYKKPILMVLNLKGLSIEAGNVELFNLEPIAEKMKSDFYDFRAESLSGTRLSSRAQMEIARILGLKYLPSLLLPCKKAIICDLDNTMYSGILAEDGASGIEITEGHRAFQKYLKELCGAGILVNIVSKNEYPDVAALFEKRGDFEIGIRDFSYVKASWQEKEISVKEIAEGLNIGLDSIIFIDDNPGELLSVKGRLKDINLVYAYDDAEKTLEVLKNYPGIYRTEIRLEDKIRKKDLAANAERRELLASLSQEEYIKKIGAELIFSIDNLEQVKRIAELGNKTNQFILCYARYAPGQIEEKMHSQSYCVIGVSLKDRLSDSGLIAAVILKREENHAVLEECFVSCRALGRGLEKFIVLGAAKLGLASMGVDRLRTKIILGERNEPARKFYKEHMERYGNGPVQMEFEFPEGLFQHRIERGGAE